MMAEKAATGAAINASKTVAKRTGRMRTSSAS